MPTGKYRFRPPGYEIHNLLTGKDEAAMIQHNFKSGDLVWVESSGIITEINSDGEAQVNLFADQDDWVPLDYIQPIYGEGGDHYAPTPLSHAAQKQRQPIKVEHLDTILMQFLIWLINERVANVKLPEDKPTLVSMFLQWREQQQR